MKKFYCRTIFAMVFVFDGCSRILCKARSRRSTELNSIIESQNEETMSSEENEGLSAEISQLLTQIEEY